MSADFLVVTWALWSKLDLDIDACGIDRDELVVFLDCILYRSTKLIDAILRFHIKTHSIVLVAEVLLGCLTDLGCHSTKFKS